MMPGRFCAGVVAKPMGAGEIIRDRVGDSVLAVGRQCGEAVLQIGPLLVLADRLGCGDDDERLVIE